MMMVMKKRYVVICRSKMDGQRSFLLSGSLVQSEECGMRWCDRMILQYSPTYVCSGSRASTCRRCLFSPYLCFRHQKLSTIVTRHHQRNHKVLYVSTQSRRTQRCVVGRVTGRRRRCACVQRYARCAYFFLDAITQQDGHHQGAISCLLLVCDDGQVK